jgi:hypothetical protein
MIVKIINESGYEQAMLGLSLSHNKLVENMPEVAMKLCDKDGGHNKFLESMAVWLDVTAPRKVWQQFDTYRAGMTKQSGSTMHTLMGRPLKQSDFEKPIFFITFWWLNILIRFKKFERLKNELPEGFLQRRIICTNYKALRHICAQRRDHKLREWQVFCDAVMGGLEYGEFIR